jgi:hypothetical protein
MKTWRLIDIWRQDADVSEYRSRLLNLKERPRVRSDSLKMDRRWTYANITQRPAEQWSINIWLSSDEEKVTNCVLGLACNFQQVPKALSIHHMFWWPLARTIHLANISLLADYSLCSAVRTTCTSGQLACVRRLEQPARVASFKTLAVVLLDTYIINSSGGRVNHANYYHRIIITSHLAMQVHVHNGCAGLMQIQDPCTPTGGTSHTSPTCRAYGGRSSLLPIQVY